VRKRLREHEGGHLMGKFDEVSEEERSVWRVKRSMNYDIGDNKKAEQNSEEEDV
jgi:hypothetical protein